MSTLKVNSIQNATGTTAVTLDASGNATFAGTVVSNSSMGMRNRIINGDMRIDQRNAGASVTQGTGTLYTLDRFACICSAASKFSIQQNAGSVTPPTGFTNYLGATSLSAYSSLASDYFGIVQYIEGYNIADLDWGTATAQTVTLSFWARSSITGTFSVSLRNSSGARSYLATYTISSANTWTYCSITIPGDTTGTWLTTTGRGIRVWFDLGSGSDATGTPGSWSVPTYVKATGGTSIVGTNGATFYITGIQLEVGSTATPFERRLYGQELALCQRYYYQTTNGNYYATGTANNTTDVVFAFPLPVYMRVFPSIGISSTGDFVLLPGSKTFTSVNSASQSATAGTGVAAFYTAGSSALTAGTSYTMYSNLTTGVLKFNSEL